MSRLLGSIFVGTSGFDYPEWRGRFYPSVLPRKRYFDWYSARFRAVEVNATFQRMPTVALAEQWAAHAPAGFSYVLKAPRAITHAARFEPRSALEAEFVRAARALGPHLGGVLFQFPPHLARTADTARLFANLCARHPRDVPASVEFRHESWFGDATFGLLREHAIALCVAHGEAVATPLVRTAPHAYLRLRAEHYTRAELRPFVAFAREAERAHVFFRHEDEARGPAFALLFASLVRDEHGSDASAVPQRRK
jgi:uncharacterized protein YecE (DUF72 family)